ncbi:helix-turn-helix domain-containing protein [Actinomadura fibrosa]|uniref:Helix-turn-helix domain-containing protein n=1 Tax=Actinomadura fibrosa TaxID=111802 RepID=A0ABW2XGA2_9ACTN|nr:helix-turn-helix domain-containing protein [Actinomadura fibrosa]
MTERMYSVEEVADLLGLHVRTVRGYIRAGRLKAVRIGKQYRIAHRDLAELTGRSPAAAPAGPVEVSSIVQVDGVGRAAADRIGTLVLAGVNGRRDSAVPLRVQVVHDEERERMKIVILGDAATTAGVLGLIDGLLGEGGGLLGEGGGLLGEGGGLPRGEDGDA